MLLACSIYCYGQLPVGKPIQTIHTELQHARADTTRLRLLHAEGEYYFINYNNNKANKQNLDTAFQRYDQALKLSLKAHLDTGYGKYPSLLKLGQILILKGDTTKGMNNLKQVAGFYHEKGYLVKEAAALHIMYKWVSTYDVVSAIKGFQKLLVLCTKLQQNDAAISAGYNCVVLNYQLNNKAESEKICLSLIKEFRFKKCTKLDLAYRMLTTIYRYQGNPNKSLQYALDAIDWTNDTQGKLSIAKASDFYGELGLTYQELGQTENSIYWYQKTIEAREKLRIDQIFIFRTAGFMIQGFIKLHRTNEGLKYLSALVKRKPPLNDNERAAITQIKAYCYNDLKQFKLAEQYYKATLLYVSKIDKEVELRAKYDMAEFYVQQQKYSDAAQFIKGLISADKPLSWTRDMHLLQFKIDSAQGRMISAMRNYQNYKALNDSVFNEAKSKQISEIQIKYATNQKENDIKSLRKDRSFQDQKMKQVNTMRNLTLLGIGLLLVVLVLLYNSFRINKKKSKEIDHKNAVLNQLVAEKDGLLQEKEWLIKEVHHRVKNNLQIVMGLLQQQSSLIDNKAALTAIQNSEHRMHSIALIHQKLYQSENFKLVDMVDYIAEMTEYLKECFDLGTRIIFEKQIDEIDFNIATAVPLGLILNEAITNSIKYAFSANENGRIQINLNQTGDDTYRLRISDNGRGLLPDFDVLKTNSMGFNLIRGLSKQLGGEFHIESEQGVTILINFKTGQHSRYN
jgi:two-component sensor histidine kinase